MIPTPAECRAYLESYGLNQTATYTLAGDLVLNSPIVHNIDTRNLLPTMLINSAHIAAGTRIVSVDIVSATVGQITLDENASANATAESLTVTYFPVISDDWIVKKRDNFVVPWAERICRTSFSATQQIEEYYSGNGTSILMLNRKPIVSLDALSYTNVMSNQYVINLLAIQNVSEEGILKVRTNFNESTWIPIFAKGLLNLRVKYTYGYASCPADIAEAIKYLICEQILGQLADRTGGGSLSVQGFSRNYGNRGKYTNVRNDLSRAAMAILRNYMTANSGA